jgi:hypothetical protein
VKPVRTPPLPAIVIESLDDHRQPGFKEALRLYHRIFPAKERIDRRYFVDLLREKRLGLLYPFNVHFLVARKQGKVVGLATGSYLSVVNMGFVGYLASEPRLKGERIGSRLRARLVVEMQRDARASGRPGLEAVMGEVEATNPWLRNLVRNRGALALDLDYRQPSLRKETPAVPLVLYYEPISGPPMRRISVRRLRAILYSIFRRVYRVRFPLRDRSLRRILKGLEGRSYVGPRRLHGDGRSLR